MSALGTILTYVIGLIGGIGVGIQAPFVGAMSGQVGGVAASLIVHISGTILSALLLAARGGENIAAWRSLPPLSFIMGAFGLLLYITVSHTQPRLGAGAALTLIIVGQLFVGLLIDQFGWFGLPVRPADPGRLIGVVLLFVGGYLVVR